MNVADAVHFEHARIKEEIRAEFSKLLPDTPGNVIDEIIEKGFERGINVSRNYYFPNAFDRQTANNLRETLGMD